MKHKLSMLCCLWLMLFYSLPVAAGAGKVTGNHPETLSVSEAPPTVGFTYIKNGGCVPVIVQFYSQFNGPGYNWNFGDGGTSTDCNPIHTYTVPGTYTVTLVATGGTYSTTITVGANPVVTIAGPNVSCQGDVMNYTATSTIPPASYSWSAQGGTVNTSTATTANITWTSYGINYVNYTITTAEGCTKIFTYKVKVIPPPEINLPCCDKRQDPTGGIKVNPGQGHEGVPGGPEPCSVCAGSYDCYQATIDPEFGIPSDYSWVWTVTNGTVIPSSDPTKICVIWGASGVGTIKLEVTHLIYLCKTIRECEVTINPGITPVFTVSGNCINTPVFFDATGTTPIADVESYFWEFGDGYSETTYLPSATHEFDFTGNYTATLTITTKIGCKYKLTQNFNVISGTKPVIVCPGTVCEGSRQCYSTTLIPGATYAWAVTGDVPGQQTINADGNEICVTWGSGPVGTVTVTVTGGGYTCTNSATEAVAIVGNVVPIDGPDYICQTAAWTEVSTANYTGACYSWRVNGIAQSAATNVLFFDASLYSSPITVEVDVDYELGCCHGKGQKTIIKLPQYTLVPYTYDECVGNTVTYFLIGSPSVPVSWSVEGGTFTSTPTSITVTWNTVGIGSITAGNNTPTEYCNDDNNNTWNVKVWDKATGEEISGPDMVCSGSTNTYFFAYEYPTASATVSASGGATWVAGPYSVDVTFPTVSVPTPVTISVTYNHAVVANCGITKTYTVMVVPAAIPTFSIPSPDVCQGDIVNYTAAMASTDYYEWEVIGGVILSETYSAGLLTLQVQWNSTLTSSITVKNKACGTSNTQDITVHGKPIVIITPSPVICGNPSITLTVAPVWTSYLWSPGGQTTNSISISTPGVYSVTVSNGFCSETGSINVPIVVPTPPTINSFTVTPPSNNYCPKFNQICPNITLGSGSIVSYAWTFSGFTITSASVQCPQVALAGMPGPSTGTWSLTVTDTYGCQHTLGGSITDSCIPIIIPPCSTAYAATFNYIGYDPCTGQFSASATNYSSIFWDFGDGTTGGGLNPTHQYTSVCDKVVNVIVVDINGCAQSFGPYVAPVPYVFVSPQLVVNNDPCLGALSIDATGLYTCSSMATNYAWTITPAGGGIPFTTNTTTSVLNVSTIGAIPNGINNVVVTMTVAGCSRTITGSFNKGGLQAYFVSCGGCAGSPISFQDMSIPYTAPIIKWDWQITGTATLNSSLQNPTITFPASGPYTVVLTITDNNLCVSSHTVNLNILPQFIPGDILVNGVSTPSNTTFNICPNDVYTLDAPPGVSFIWSTGSSASSITVTEPGDYYVTVFDANNCAGKVGPIRFYFKPAPEAIIQASADLCAPRLLRAFTGTGYTYNWNYPPYTSAGPYIYLYNSGPVTLTVSNVHGCSATVTQPFMVNPTPSVGINYAPQPFCPGSTVTLTATPSGGTAPYSYLWNNSPTTLTNTVSQPGLYQVWVTDNNGCVGTSQYNLQPVLPSGMDKLPYGCYDVCQPVSFCTGTMPFGWTGQWYLNGSPYGGVIPQGGNIATTFSSSGTYVLHYTPVNPSVACFAQSKPITINFIAMPAFTIVHGTDPTLPLVICVNSGQTVPLTVTPQDPNYTYTWLLNGVPVGTGYTHNATAPGVYSVEIAKNPCCKVVVEVTVIEEDCCFENAGVPFTNIWTTRIVTSNEFWYDKYYVNAPIIVLGSAELDLTNVDMVFGPNGRIELYGTSFLRCNNSVLRPCEKDDIWQGVSFFNNSSGWINTSTIKNAVVGVLIRGNERGVRLTDNAFIKCHTSVSIENSRAQQSISGNSFEVDDSNLPYPSAPNQYTAIRLFEAEMKGLIAQNEFRHVEPRKGNNIYMGIYSEFATYTASQNLFNDMYRSVDVINNWNVVALEENEIKINHLKELYDVYQVRITNCDNPVLVYENKFDNGLGDNSVAGAIYCEQTYRTHIKDNTFNGFYQSIRARSTETLHITSNTITSNSNTGIAVEGTNNTFISCNNINSRHTNTSAMGGPLYGITDWFGNGSSQIYANCIFNMNTAIYLINGGGNNLPPLVNNYMYNYMNNGIYTDGYFGDIGFPGPATVAGRNTFMSNNGAAGVTFDINSTVPINEAGNFGILMTNNVTSTSGPDEFYSTAACGQQIQQTYPQNQLDRYNVCDVYNLEEWIWRNSDGMLTLKPSTREITVADIEESLKAGNGEAPALVTSQMLKGTAEAERAAAAVLSSTMNKNVAATLLTTNCLAIDNPQLAQTLLANPALMNIDADLKQVLNITLEVARTLELTAAQRQVLKGIDDKNVLYSPLAREIVQAMNREHDYKFPKPRIPELKEAQNVLVRAGNNLTVYPVPAMQTISVEHTVTDARVQGVKIVSAIGAEVANFTYTIQAGVVDIDISALAAGVYSVILVTDNETAAPMTGRFIKLQ